jgi:predicted RNA-binding protein YlxR (DUF448 family)
MSIGGHLPKRQHSPRRTCLGCGARDDQSRLIRLRAGDRGELSADGSRLGRGGYLHHGHECWEQFLKRKSVYRAFHAEIGRSAREILVQELKERYGA